MTDTPTPPDPFNSATYYACDNPEHLTHTHPVDALEEYLPNLGTLDQTLREVIETEAPIEVTAYVREEIPADRYLNEAESMVEAFIESMEEDFGDPDGDQRFIKEEDEKTLAQAIAGILVAAQSRYHIWRCEEVATREYTEEMLLELFADRIAEEETKAP